MTHGCPAIALAPQLPGMAEGIQAVVISASRNVREARRWRVEPAREEPRRLAEASGPHGSRRDVNGSRLARSRAGPLPGRHVLEEGGG
jgi:hypothetical protein